MDCVILYRNLENGKIGFITDDSGELAVFPDFDAAVTAVESETIPILQLYPYQIVILDEL